MHDRIVRMAGTGSEVSRQPEPSDPDLAAAFHRVADLLEEQMDSIAADLTDAYRDSLPGFADVSWSSIHAGTRRSTEVIVRALRRGVAPGEEDAEKLRVLARRWAATELPLESIGRSFHVGSRRAVWLIGAHADDLGLDARSMFAVQDALWQWVWLGSSVIADVVHEQALAEARLDATRLADFLRDLASGRMTEERLSADAALYGLDLSQQYVAVYASSTGARQGSLLEAKIRQSGATSTHRVLQTIVDRTLLGVAPRRPTAPDGVAMGVGPPVLLNAARESFAEAWEALATAEAFSMTGTFDLTTVGPLALVTIGDHVASRVAAERLVDLGAECGDIEQTVLTLLEFDQSIDRTATDLHLHRNTVRYRVTRFRDMTGLDLRRTEDLVTAWWLLKWRQAQRGN